MSDITLARALMAQIDVNFALTEALLQIIVEAKLAETDSLKNAITAVADKNSELIDMAKTMINSATRKLSDGNHT